MGAKVASDVAKDVAPPPRWVAAEDANRFAAFRIVFATVLLFDVIHLFTHRGLFLRTSSWTFPTAPALAVWLLVLVCLLAGFRTRIASIANYLCCALMLGIVAPEQGFQQGAGDSVTIGLSLLAVILPCGAVAVDRIGTGGK